MDGWWWVNNGMTEKLTLRPMGQIMPITKPDGSLSYRIQTIIRYRFGLGDSFVVYS